MLMTGLVLISMWNKDQYECNECTNDADDHDRIEMS